MRFNSDSLTKLIYIKVWIWGIFILLHSPTLYGITPNSRTTLSLSWQSPSEPALQNPQRTPPKDTLAKLGFAIQVKGRKIIVADQDLPSRISWSEAQNLCSQLGQGWRLPTKDELESMYTQLYLQSLGNFYNMGYWSSQEVDANNAWVMYFLNGYAHPTRKLMPIKVRPVRSP